MTMRLDIVTNDAGELVRRELTRDLGAGVVVSIYRLAKLAQLHNLTNQAFLQQLDQTHAIIGDYCLRSGANVNILFAQRAVFVAGQLLKGSRAVYENAQELGEILDWLGGSDLTISRDVTRDEILKFAEGISTGLRSERGTFQSPTPRIRLRPVAEAARLRGLEIEDLDQDQKTVRMYASAVVIMRRFFEDLLESKYILPRRIKRVAQSLVDLSEGATPAFLGVTEARNANHDEAGRAVNTAILAVTIAREITQDRVTLAQIAMAGMMHDVARPRALAIGNAAAQAAGFTMTVSTLSEEQEDRLASGAAAVLTALGRVNEPSMTRTVVAFEALWMRRQQWLGVLYGGARPPTMHARIVRIARRYNDLLTPEPGLPPPTPDFAVATLSEELTDAQDKTVLRMLAAALGLLPTGTLVQLSTGEVGEVTRGAVSQDDKPALRLVMDKNGGVLPSPIEIDLAQPRPGDPPRAVARVINVDNWKKGLERFQRPGTGSDAPPPSSGPRSAVSPPPQVAPPPPPPPSPAYSQPQGTFTPRSHERSLGSDSHGSVTGSSSSSLPSMGSSPSAVAEAMGRMINDSLKPSVPPKADEKTVFQPASPVGSAGETQRPSASAEIEPTARGTLAATPLAHVLVYMLDHGLSGSVVFYDLDGSEHVIHFERGAPAKVRHGGHVALLGQVLASANALDEAQLENYADGAARLGVLLGEYLVGHDLVSREMLAWALETQTLEKIAMLANLAPETNYSFFKDMNLLDQWGGSDQPQIGALNAILAAVRTWHDRARVRATLNRIGKHPLVLHAEADVTSLVLAPDEEAIIDVIRAESPSLPQLFKMHTADEEVVSSLVYTLAVTRQFAFKGQKKGPMAPRAESMNPPSSRMSSVSSMQAVVAAEERPSTTRIQAPSEPRYPVSQRAMPAAQPAAPIPRSPSSPGRPTAPAAPARPAPTPAARPAATPSGEVRAASPGAGPGGAPRPGAPQIRPRQGAPAIRPIGAGPAAGAAPRPGAAPAGGAVGGAPGVARAPAARPAAAGPAGAPAPGAKKAAGTLLGTGGALGVGARPGPGAPGPAPLPRPSVRMAIEPARPAPAPNPVAPTARPPAADDADIPIDEGGMEDAELALEAMTNFRLAEAAMQRNDTATALKLAQKAVDGDPRQLEYCALLAWIKSLRTSDPKAIEASIQMLSEIIAEDPTIERALLYRGKLYKRSNNVKDALADFDALLQQNPHHREAQGEQRALKARK